MAQKPREDPLFRYNMPHVNTLAKRKGQHIEFYSISHGYAVAFPAFLTKLSQKFTTPTKEIKPGQTSAAPVYVRTGGIERGIDVSFQVVSDTRRVAFDNLAKLGALIRMLYPTMTKSTNTFDGRTDDSYKNPTPSVWDLRFLNLISYGGQGLSSDGGDRIGVTAIIKDFNTDFDLDSGFVEHPTNNDLYPKLINVSMQLVVIPFRKHGWVKISETESQEIPGFEGFPFGEPNDKTRNRTIYTPDYSVDQATPPAPAPTTNQAVENPAEALTQEQQLERLLEGGIP